jgi:hypothetical protein
MFSLRCRNEKQKNETTQSVSGRDKETWPSAGPRGGAGVAELAGMYMRTLDTIRLDMLAFGAQKTLYRHQNLVLREQIEHVCDFSLAMGDDYDRRASSSASAPASGTDRNRVFIGGLTPAATPSELDTLLAKYGQVNKADHKGTLAFVVR